MSKKNKQKKEEFQQEPQQEATVEQTAQETTEKEEKNTQQEAEPTLEQQLEQLKGQLEHEKKEYLFLMAEFDNFRKRTLKEKQELIKDGARRAMEALLPVVDDIERAMASIDGSDDVTALKEGVDLIYSKFMGYLKTQNVTPIVSTGELFDTDLHEAVTTFPAPDEAQKGRVIDTVLKGYKINDKVLRHAKVVVGQ